MSSVWKNLYFILLRVECRCEARYGLGWVSQDGVIRGRTVEHVCAIGLVVLFCMQGYGILFLTKGVIRCHKILLFHFFFNPFEPGLFSFGSEIAIPWLRHPVKRNSRRGS